jgi:hypothetical protein
LGPERKAGAGCEAGLKDFSVEKYFWFGEECGLLYCIIKQYC